MIDRAQNKNIKSVIFKAAKLYFQKGEDFSTNGEFQGAMSYFNQALSRNSQLIEAYLSKCWILELQGKYQESIRCYEQGIINNQYEQNVVFQIAQFLKNSGKYEAAIRIYDEAINMNPNNIDFQFYKAQLLENQGKYEDATRCYVNIIRINPSNSKFLHGTASLLQKSGKYEEAIRYYDEVIKAYPNNNEFLIGKAYLLNVLIMPGKYEEAIRYQYEAIRASSDDSEFCFQKMNLLNNVEDFENAVSCYVETIMVNDHKFQLSKAKMLKQKGKYDVALKYQDEAVGANSNNNGKFQDTKIIQLHLTQLADKLTTQGLQSVAITSYDEFRRAKQCKSAIFTFEIVEREIQLVIFLRKSGEYEEAIFQCNEGIRENPIYIKFYIHKAKVLEKMGKQLEAINCYDQIIRMNPSYSESFIRKGQLLTQKILISIQVIKKSGKYEDMGCYDGAIRLNPSDNESFIFKARLLKKLGKQEEAISCQNQFIFLNPHDKRPEVKKAQMLQKKGHYEEAIKQYSIAINMNPISFEIYEHKANLLQLLGRSEEALKCCDEGIRADPNDFQGKRYSLKAKLLEQQNKIKEAFICQILSSTSFFFKFPIYKSKIKSLAQRINVSEQFTNALNCYDQAIRISKNKFTLYCLKAQFLQGHNLFKEALINYKLAQSNQRQAIFYLTLCI